MLKGILILSMVVGASNNIGVVKNENYIQFIDGTGYYSEHNIDLDVGSVVYLKE